MKSPRVFVIQNQHRWSAEQREFVPKYDVGSAKQYGDLHEVLSPTASPFKPALVLPDIRAALSDFSDDDYLLLIGNPVLIGMSVAIAAAANKGRVKLLQWSGKESKYICVQIVDLQ